MSTYIGTLDLRTNVDPNTDIVSQPLVKLA